MGKVVAEDDTLTFWRNRGGERKFNDEYKKGFGKPECWECGIPLKPDSVKHEDVIENFVNAILDGEELIAPGEEGINSLMLSNAMLLSEWKGNTPVKIPFDDEEFYKRIQQKIDNSKSSNQTKIRDTERRRN